jgi:hypothetical protein
MEYRIRAKNDLFNNGQCFTKDKIYTVETSRSIFTNASLMDMKTTNDLNEKHLIGSWWREFDLEKTYIVRNGSQEEKIKRFSYEEARKWVNDEQDEPNKWEIEEQNY